MTKLRELYYCKKCGNVVEIQHEGAPALVCCGDSMILLEAKTEDASTEKHVPYVEKSKNGILVKVGKETAHPMLDAHYIKFIEVLTKNKVYKAELSPGMLPEAEFPVSIDDVVSVREYCNVHGLWKN